MKKLLLFYTMLFGTCCIYSQSQIISAVPVDGIGKQNVCIHSYTGQVAGASNRAFNLLYNVSEGSTSTKRWYNNTEWFPWVVFELTDFYSIDKIVFRDVRTKDATYGNVQEFYVYVSSKDPSFCQWKRVAHKQGTSSMDVKEIALDNADSVRYIKFICSPGIKADQTWDDGVRIYGLDIYGILSEKVERESVSTGKTVLGFNGALNYYERPLNILDGNTSNVESVWYSSRPDISDSLRWVVIDLEKNCNINGFRLYDAKVLITKAPNFSGYNVYVSSEMPDISKVVANKDENTCWKKVVDAYAVDRSAQNIKTDAIESVDARYVKLEIPRSRITGYLRVFQFEVLGQELATLVEEVKEVKGFSLIPTQLKQGETFSVCSGKVGILKIFNIQGMIVAEYLLQSGIQQTISAERLSPGIYIVNFNNDNQKLIVK